jgi:hypothetical protein
MRQNAYSAAAGWRTAWGSVSEAAKNVFDPPRNDARHAAASATDASGLAFERCGIGHYCIKNAS